MKLRMIVSSLMIILLSAAVSTNVNAAPWRGYCFPHPVVRICAPAPVIAPPVVVGGYYGYARPYYHGYYRYRDCDRYRDHDGYRGYYRR
jgi:hypothetical protein